MLRTIARTSKSIVMVGIKKNIPKKAVCTGNLIQRRLPTFQGTSLGLDAGPPSQLTQVVEPNANPQSYSNRCSCQYQIQDRQHNTSMIVAGPPVTCHARSSTGCHNIAATRI